VILFILRDKLITMDNWRTIGQQLLSFLIILGLILPECLGLQCFNCIGETDLDHSSCLNPTLGRTLIQECLPGEVCEKKVMLIEANIEGITEQIVRGCSSNCDGREYIWTEDFRVHCCNDDNMCNSATRGQLSVLSGLIAALSAILLALWQHWLIYSFVWSRSFMSSGQPNFLIDVIS